MRKIIVQKFGGTSVADTDKIKRVAQTVIKEKNNGNDVVVVVSAMGHTTDYLVKMAKDLCEVPSGREMDMLLSTGEGVSIALLAMAIQAAGYEAVSFNAMQVGIMTENVHSKARIIDIKTEKLKKNLAEGKIIVVAGFQGVTEDGEITTLGRGGSDTSAVALAAALNAERCDIYTDVEGVYTTDPRVVPTASRLDEISYEEMLELAHAGANVLHPRSVETAKQFNVPLRVRSSFKTDNLFGRLAEENISVDMIIQSYARKVSNTNDIAFTIDASDIDKTISTLNSLKSELNCGEIQINNEIAKVSIVGAGMIDRPGIASTMFETLAEQGVNIRMISTSEIKISCLVDKEDAKKAVKALHDVFGLNCEVEAEVKGDLPNI